MLRISSFVYLFCFIIITLTNNGQYIHWLYLLFIVKFMFTFYYSVINFNLLSVNISNERFNEDELNANVFGYYAYFATFSSFILSITLTGLKKYLAFIGIFICTALSMIAAIYTASRQILIIQGILLISLFFIRYLLFENRKSKLFIMLLAIILTILARIIDISPFSGLTSTWATLVQPSTWLCTITSSKTNSEEVTCWALIIPLTRNIARNEHIKPLINI